ncbi:23S rRNA (adenine(2030)-N(6))-methyltransferase RlmJ [Xanthomonadaceae bacterium XH05]|nr:23S rRNA (adenine(2030)-N(6))-methyltransferase RlmJ [Xanthomonadaceae bacterium XH05]
MNYHHAYHAGNHADVLKHLVVLAVLDALARKPAPYFVLDTHAGQGRYALASEKAGKTGEARAGILRLVRHDFTRLSQGLRRYLDAVRPHLSQDHYPGSPQLIADALRDSDRLACCELQPEPFGLLKGLLAGDHRVGIHHRDGYDAMKALLPPPEKRGLVLIDPPYEAQLAEFDLALAALRAALARWPQGIFALWYPIKQRRSLQPFLRRAATLPAKSAFVVELNVRPDDSPLRMNGSGLLILNPPWKLDQSLATTMPALSAALDEGGGGWRLEWIKREQG